MSEELEDDPEDEWCGGAVLVLAAVLAPIALGPPAAGGLLLKEAELSAVAPLS